MIFRAKVCDKDLQNIAAKISKKKMDYTQNSLNAVKGILKILDRNLDILVIEEFISERTIFTDGLF